MPNQIPHVGVLKTDGGAHPPDMWAEATANEIANMVQVDEQSTSDLAKLARKAKPRFALDLLDAMETFHDKVQKHEREHLKNKGTARLLEEHDHDQFVDDAVKEVVKLAEKTPFSNDFKKPEVMKHVKTIITQDMDTVAHIERSWHADKHMHDDKAKQWFTAKHGGLPE